MAREQSSSFTPTLMTPAVGAALREAGYILPESWPTNARVIASTAQAEGWRLVQPGSITDPDHPNWIANHEARFPEPIYVAPDGTRFTYATNGARVVAVKVSTKLSPKMLRIAPGTRRPKWVIEDTPKGEIPEHLKKFLLRKGEKLAKGQQRLANEAERFAVEPQMPAAGKVQDADAARWVREALAADPDQKPGAMLAQLRKAGRSISGKRFRAAYAAAMKGGR